MAITAGSRRGPLPALRATLVMEIVTTLGLSLAEVARQLSVTIPAISRAVRRPGREEVDVGNNPLTFRGCSCRFWRPPIHNVTRFSLTATERRQYVPIQASHLPFGELARA